MYAFCGPGYSGSVRLIRPYETVRPSARGIDNAACADREPFSGKGILCFRTCPLSRLLYKSLGFNLVRHTATGLICGDRVIKAEPDIVHLSLTIKDTAF